MYTTELRMLSVDLADTSLIGVSKERPVSFGNYFSLYYDNEVSHENRFDFDRVRILNMWWENLEALTNPHGIYMYAILPDRRVEVKIYTDMEKKRRWGIVTDKRVPKNYLWNKLCFTGYYMPPVEIAKDMYAILGDPDNEFEQFTDPEVYWDKRGAHYDSKTGIISYSAHSKTRKVKNVWVVEQEELKVVHESKAPKIVSRKAKPKLKLVHDADDIEREDQ